MNILEISKSSSAITEFSFFSVFFRRFSVFFRQCSTTSEVCATRNNRQGGVRRPSCAAPLWVSLSIRIAADFHRTTVVTAPGRKLLTGRRPTRNWTQLQFFSLSRCFVQKITFVLTKINKNCYHQSCTFWLQYIPNCLPAGVSPQTHWGSL